MKVAKAETEVFGHFSDSVCTLGCKTTPNSRWRNLLPHRLQENAVAQQGNQNDTVWIVSNILHYLALWSNSW